MQVVQCVAYDCPESLLMSADNAGCQIWPVDCITYEMRWKGQSAAG